MYSHLVILVPLLMILALFPAKTYAAGPVTLNEALVHPSAGGKEWVEFYVTDSSELKSYWIDDDTDFANDIGSAKKSLDTVLQGNTSQHYFIELSASMFNNSGDTIVLFKSDGTMVDQLSYADGPGYDVTMGRTPDMNGSFQYLSNATRGSPNSGPRPTVTPTPQPTEAPTRQPVSTKEPTATTRATNTSSPTVRATRVPSPTLPKASSTPRAASASANAKTATSGAYPTAILGMNATAEPTRIPLPSIPVKVKSASNTPAVATLFGAAFIIACAILLIVKKMRKAT